MCDNCIAKVTTVLNEAFGERNWEVDTKNLRKILTVSSETVYEKDVKKALEGVGYKAEELA